MMSPEDLAEARRIAMELKPESDPQKRSETQGTCSRCGGPSWHRVDPDPCIRHLAAQQKAMRSGLEGWKADQPIRCSEVIDRVERLEGQMMTLLREVRLMDGRPYMPASGEAAETPKFCEYITTDYHKCLLPKNHEVHGTESWCHVFVDPALSRSASAEEIPSTELKQVVDHLTQPSRAEEECATCWEPKDSKAHDFHAFVPPQAKSEPNERRESPSAPAAKAARRTFVLTWDTWDGPEIRKDEGGVTVVEQKDGERLIDANAGERIREHDISGVYDLQLPSWTLCHPLEWGKCGFARHRTALLLSSEAATERSGVTDEARRSEKP